MFGYVSASTKELTPEAQERYQAVYCGVCRRIRTCAGQLGRLCLSYDMAFLALLLMSLYEPEEIGGPNACALHPIRKRPWIDNEYVIYSAEMNVALAYYNCLDDWQDDHSLAAKKMADHLQGSVAEIATRYPRQCQAIRECIEELSQLEQAQCANPDTPANCFGRLMGELLVYREDLWAPKLRQLGMSLGRFIYLADAAQDYAKDKKRGKYNPYLAAGIHDPSHWDQHLVLAMGRCTAYFEQLPLVQDKDILNNILYSGVWTQFRKKRKEASE